MVTKKEVKKETVKVAEVKLDTVLRRNGETTINNNKTSRRFK